jgi:hypothetical protein
MRFSRQPPILLDRAGIEERIGGSFAGPERIGGAFVLQASA